MLPLNAKAASRHGVMAELNVDLAKFLCLVKTVQTLRRLIVGSALQRANLNSVSEVALIPGTHVVADKLLIVQTVMRRCVFVSPLRTKSPERVSG